MLLPIHFVPSAMATDVQKLLTKLINAVSEWELENENIVFRGKKVDEDKWIWPAEAKVGFREWNIAQINRRLRKLLHLMPQALKADGIQELWCWLNPERTFTKYVSILSMKTYYYIYLLCTHFMWARTWVGWSNCHLSTDPHAS